MTTGALEALRDLARELRTQQYLARTGGVDVTEVADRIDAACDALLRVPPQEVCANCGHSEPHNGPCGFYSPRLRVPQPSADVEVLRDYAEDLSSVTWLAPVSAQEMNTRDRWLADELDKIADALDALLRVTPSQDAAGGSLPDTQRRQSELPAGDSVASSLPAAVIDHSRQEVTGDRPAVALEGSQLPVVRRAATESTGARLEPHASTNDAGERPAPDSTSVLRVPQPSASDDQIIDAGVRYGDGEYSDAEFVQRMRALLGGSAPQPPETPA